ncbi:MAG: cohesin domain-containing protein [Minisyncoccia bacterium]
MLDQIIKFVRQEKSIIIVMVATVAVFSIASLFSYQVTHWIELISFDKTGQIRQGLNADSQYVFKNTGEIAASSGLVALIEERDTPQLTSALQDEQAIRHLDSLSVTDGAGIVLTQTHASCFPSGDYIFQTTAYGQKVAEGAAVVSIERGSGASLLMVAGYPVTDHGQMVGAVFGDYSIDDAYVHGFRSKYLNGTEDVIFYSKQDGVVGTTFENPNTKLLLAAYFNTGSDWILKGQSDREVIIEGRAYFVKNLIFSGPYGESAGGVLVLYPASYTAEAAIFSLIIVLLFALIMFYLHTHRAMKRRRVAEVMILIVCSLIVFFAIFFTDRSLLYSHSTLIQKPPYTIYNSTLALDPSFAVWSGSSEPQVAVEVSTGGEAINAAQIDITYDPTKVQVEDIITANSFCAQDMFLQKNIDNKHGEVQVACILPNPGFIGVSGNVVTLALQPIQAGNVTLHFATGTQILANDGLGTDVLRLTTDGSYRIIDEATAENSTSSVIVFSPTYPDSAQWYNKPDGLFTWIASPGYRYLYSLNNISAMTTLAGASTTSADSVSFSGLTDGIYYFHIQPIKDGITGAISDYKVMIDTTPPSVPVIKASATTVPEGQAIRLMFESEDDTSGLQDNYYIQVDDGVFLPTPSSLSLYLLRAGTHTITVRVFDRASNFADGNIMITVTKSQ